MDWIIGSYEKPKQRKSRKPELGTKVNWPVTTAGSLSLMYGGLGWFHVIICIFVDEVQVS